MNKMKLSVISLSVFAVIVAILMYNKSKMEAKSQTDILKPIPVTVGTAAKMDLSDAHSLTGTIVPNNDIAIVSETEGKVVAVYAKVGDTKEAGAVLFAVDDELKKAALATAEVNLEKSKKDFERFESLQGQNAVTASQYEGARLALKSAEAQFIVARKQYNDTKISTPIAGIVTSRLVDRGTMVQQKMVVANVVDISRLKVKLSVAERDAFRLAPGNDVEITTDIYPGVTFGGKIESVSAKSDDAHTYPVEISLPNNKAHPLKAGMFARVSFRPLMRGDALAIPRSALVGSFKQPQVYVVENGIAKLRNIVVDDEVGSHLRVLSGLKEGEEIVVNGQNNLKDNVPVTIVK
jgi:RND family efflux transporter MFP subunit